MKLTKSTTIHTEKLTESELAEINRFSGRALDADEVFTFRVLLCDNEVDRDGEAFTLKALEELSVLFVGKTGILNHDPKAENQLGRIYRTELKTDSTKLTALGEEYSYIEAKVYIPRTKSNEEIITKIETGVLKEVSVGCAVKRSFCSVCGEEHCSHVTGENYGGKTCAKRLDGGADAYEFSFVAVPAQRNAGVTKNYKGGNMEKRDVMKMLCENEGEIILTKAEGRELYKLADAGRVYRASLEKSIRKSAVKFCSGISGEIMENMMKCLDIEELKSLEKEFARLAEEKLPLDSPVQTRGDRTHETSNNYFCI
ncbi:MAG: hypothetical protein Q4C42_04550 [Clostridia bacterium]|nr:hypothetical protein [Clostridia bacterium]